MPTHAQQLGASKSESTLLVLFIPSRDRDGSAIDQDRWVHEALEALGGLLAARRHSRRGAASGATTSGAEGLSTTSRL